MRFFVPPEKLQKQRKTAKDGAVSQAGAAESPKMGSLATIPRFLLMRRPSCWPTAFSGHPGMRISSGMARCRAFGQPFSLHQIGFAFGALF
jgi:hypothetical protein